jgi:antitoxin component YwqK of YwqJK toxin-antitoxin module
MKPITGFTLIVCLLFNAAPSAACNCVSKARLDARDWNDASIILQVEIMNVETSEEVGRLTFETINTFKGPDPGPEAAVNYYLDECHSAPHELSDIRKGQQWLLFLELDEGAMRLKRTGLDGYCPLSRKLGKAKTAHDLQFLAAMKNGSSGPAELHYPDGTLMAVGAYDNGLASGEWTYYDYSGNVVERGVYTEGRRSGAWNRYAMNFNSGRQYVFATDHYSEGRLAVIEEFDQLGKMLVQHEYKDQGQRRTTYYSDDGLVDYAMVSHPLSSTRIYIDYFPDGTIGKISYVENGREVSQPHYVLAIPGLAAEEGISLYRD